MWRYRINQRLISTCNFTFKCRQVRNNTWKENSVFAAFCYLYWVKNVSLSVQIFLHFPIFNGFLSIWGDIYVLIGYCFRMNISLWYHRQTTLCSCVFIEIWKSVFCTQWKKYKLTLQRLQFISKHRFESKCSNEMITYRHLSCFSTSRAV